MVTSGKYYNVVFTLNTFFLIKKNFNIFYLVLKQIKLNTNTLITISLKSLNTFQLMKIKKIYNSKVKGNLKILESI
jgi:hypothetical protein